jgi:hypothetical protein
MTNDFWMVADFIEDNQSSLVSMILTTAWPHLAHVPSKRTSPFTTVALKPASMLTDVLHCTQKTLFRIRSLAASGIDSHNFNAAGVN